MKNDIRHMFWIIKLTRAYFSINNILMDFVRKIEIAEGTEEGWGELHLGVMFIYKL